MSSLTASSSRKLHNDSMSGQPQITSSGSSIINSSFDMSGGSSNRGSLQSNPSKSLETVRESCLASPSSSASLPITASSASVTSMDSSKQSGDGSSDCGAAATNESTDVTDAVDPRVREELDNLTNCGEMINSVETRLTEARSAFRERQGKAATELELLARKIGKKRISQARPYFDALQESKEALSTTQFAAQEYQRASNFYDAAKETLYLAEHKFISEKKVLTPAWQEMLNHANLKFGDAEKARSSAEKFHREKASNHQEKEIKVKLLLKKLKRTISKSKPYFDKKARLEDELAKMKVSVGDCEAAKSQQKALYHTILRRLEAISNEEHAKRRLMEELSRLPAREPGVGAESDSASQTSSLPPVKLGLDFSGDEGLDGDDDYSSFMGESEDDRSSISFSHRSSLDGASNRSKSPENSIEASPSAAAAASPLDVEAIDIEFQPDSTNESNDKSPHIIPLPDPPVVDTTDSDEAFDTSASFRGRLRRLNRTETLTNEPSDTVINTAATAALVTASDMALLPDATIVNDSQNTNNYNSANNTTIISPEVVIDHVNDINTTDNTNNAIVDDINAVNPTADNQSISPRSEGQQAAAGPSPIGGLEAASDSSSQCLSESDEPEGAFDSRRRTVIDIADIDGLHISAASTRTATVTDAVESYEQVNGSEEIIKNGDVKVDLKGNSNRIADVSDWAPNNSVFKETILTSSPVAITTTSSTTVITSPTLSTTSPTPSTTAPAYSTSSTSDLSNSITVSPRRVSTQNAADNINDDTVAVVDARDANSNIMDEEGNNINRGLNDAGKDQFEATENVSNATNIKHEYEPIWI